MSDYTSPEDIPTIAEALATEVNRMQLEEFSEALDRSMIEMAQPQDGTCQPTYYELPGLRYTGPPPVPSAPRSSPEEDRVRQLQAIQIFHVRQDIQRLSEHPHSGHEPDLPAAEQSDNREARRRSHQPRHSHSVRPMQRSQAPARLSPPAREARLRRARQIRGRDALVQGLYSPAIEAPEGAQGDFQNMSSSPDWSVSHFERARRVVAAFRRNEPISREEHARRLTRRRERRREMLQIIFRGMERERQAGIIGPATLHRMETMRYLGLGRSGSRESDNRSHGQEDEWDVLDEGYRENLG